MPTAVLLTGKKAAEAKRELARIDAEYVRQERALIRTCELGKLGFQAIDGMAQFAFQTAIPTIAGMAEMAAGYEGTVAEVPVLKAADTLAMQYLDHVTGFLDTYAGVVTRLVGQGFDLEEDDRGWVDRHLKGPRR